MMPVELFLAFVLASAILAATPGPNVSLIVANGTSYGLRAGLMTVAGGISGVAILTAGATLGMNSLMVLMSDWFDLIRWAGAAYLVWLGISRIRAAWKREPEWEAPQVKNRRWYWQALAVSLSNPKTMLFLGAFFPQFVDHSLPVAGQLWLLAVTFVIILALVDSSYALLAGSARNWITKQRMRMADSVTGLLLICGGAWLALSRRA